MSDDHTSRLARDLTDRSYLGRLRVSFLTDNLSTVA